MEPVTQSGSFRLRTFRFRQCLGRGAFGEVYLCTMTSTGGVEGDVALKVLHGDLDPKSQGVSRLLDEARMLGLLNHPCIVQGTDLVLLDGRDSL